MSAETREVAARISVNEVASAVTDGVLRAVELRLQQNGQAGGKISGLDISRFGGRFEFFVDVVSPGNLQHGGVGGIQTFGEG